MTIHTEHVRQSFNEPIIVTASSHDQATVFNEVVAERKYQDTLWGPAYERENMKDADWIRVIGEYANGTGRAEKYDFKTRMIKVAALAIAAREQQLR